MAVENLKSGSITNLDTVPVTPNSSGEGGVGTMREVDGVSAVSAGSSVTSTYRMVRLPTNAKLKALEITGDAAPGAGAVNVGASYSDSTIDGTSVANQGVLISATAFASAVTIGAAGVRVDGLSGFLSNKRSQPLWQALGLTSDPGGFIDVLLTVSTAVTNGLNLEAQARFVM